MVACHDMGSVPRTSLIFPHVSLFRSGLNFRKAGPCGGILSGGGLIYIKSPYVKHNIVIN